jgi:hypothetical protein
MISHSFPMVLVDFPLFKAITEISCSLTLALAISSTAGSRPGEWEAKARSWGKAACEEQQVYEIIYIIFIYVYNIYI